MYHDNPRRAAPGPSRLTATEYAAVKRGYASGKITRRTGWKFDLGARIAAEGEPLDEGLRSRGYTPPRRRQ